VIDIIKHSSRSSVDLRACGTLQFDDILPDRRRRFMFTETFTSYGILIGTGLLALTAWPMIYEHLVVPNLSIERQADLAEDSWRKQRRQEGYTADEMSMEYWVRNGLAEIQELASEAIYHNDGGDINDEINQIGTVQIEVLTGLNPAYGRALTDVLKDTRKEELIYPDALVELERQYRSEESLRPEDWRPTRSPGHRPTTGQLDRAAWIRLNALTTRH
jgi:hypothetical protein